MRLGIIGARGIGNHGGFETVVRELAPRLHDKGHEVYCSVRNSDDCATHSEFHGVKLMRFPFRFPKSYSLGKIWEVLYDSYFVLKCRLILKCDAIYCLGVASGLMLLLTRSPRSISLMNVDGLEWTRAKFGFITQLFLRVSFMASCMGSDRIILDNSELEHSVPIKYRPKCAYVPYGVSTMRIDDQSREPLSPNPFETLGIDEYGYWLVVARLEPENNIHMILDAYLSSESRMPIVVVGGYSSRSYENALLDVVKHTDRKKMVIMPGPIYDQELLTRLRQGCFAYVHGHSVGGTNPSLLEAMSVGNTILSHDNVFNREVCADTAMYFKNTVDLAGLMREVEGAASSYKSLGERARERAETHYRWDDVVAKLEEILCRGRLE